MKQTKSKFNVDTLKLSFEILSERWEGICQYEQGSLLDYSEMGFLMKIFEIDTDNNGTINKVSCNVIWFGGEQDGEQIGILTFCSPSIYNGRAFFTLSNKQLYRTPMYVINELWNVLDLKLKSITQMDIALDKTSNSIRNIRRMIQDHENYDMIRNGRVITAPKEKIENYKECRGRSRTKLDKYPTLYFDLREKRTPELKLYNKTKEIQEESNKNYITEVNGFGKDTFYRLELKLYWQDIKKLMEMCDIDIEDYECLIKLTSEETLQAMFEEVVPRLIRFREKKNGNIIQPTDL